MAETMQLRECQGRKCRKRRGRELRADAGEKGEPEKDI